MRIGLILNILDEEYQISFYKGLCNQAKKFGVDVICFQQEYKVLSSDEFISVIQKKEFFDLDGIIILTSVIVDNFELNEKSDIQKMWGNIPSVSIGQKVKNVPSILVQTQDSIKQLVEHLVIKHNYRNFLFLSGSQNHSDAISRQKIFTQSMNEYKKKFLDLRYTIKNGDFTEISVINIMNEYLRKNEKDFPDVVFCSNDNMAIGVYKFLKINKNNPKVKKIAVTGIDDIPQAKFFNPSLTTVRQPLKKIGEESVNYIIKMIEQNENPKDMFVDSQVIFRESCGCIKNQNIEEKNKIFEQIQQKYIRSENILKLVSHIGQSLDLVQNIKQMNELIKINIDQLSIKDFVILQFPYEKKHFDKKNMSVLVNPIFVQKNGKEYFDFSTQKNLPLGLFYKQYLKINENKNKNSTLIFKYLSIGNETLGCILYDADSNVLPYLGYIATSISQTLNRIKESEEKQKRSQFLEKEVTKRTKQLVEANNKRLEVEAKVLKISELERQRFSNDLHDDICQQLAGISMLCRSYSKQEKSVEKNQMIELAQLISQTLQSTRQYAHNSYPVELESLGINQSLHNLCMSFESQSNIICSYSWQVDSTFSLSKTQKLNIFRIIQEALHNVLKHSKAQNVQVQLKSIKNELTIEITDDGCGIKNKEEKGLGLNSMQYRANQIGATFTIKDNIPKGTKICVKLKK